MKRKVLIVFDDMIADMKANKKNKPYSHWIVFKSQKTQYLITQSYFKVPKIIKLNDTHIILSWKYLTKEWTTTKNIESFI